MARDRWLTVRMSEPEERKLKRAAASAGMSRSSYARKAITGEIISITQLNIDGRKLDELLYALKRSSSNLNQIAKRANQGVFDASAAQSAIEEHVDVARRLSEFIDETRGARCS